MLYVWKSVTLLKIQVAVRLLENLVQVILWRALIPQVSVNLMEQGQIIDQRSVIIRNYG